MDLDNFKEYLIEDGKAENTIKSYCRDVKNYADWLQDTFGDIFVKFYFPNVAEYKSWLLNSKKIKERSVNAKILGLKKYNQFLVDQGVQDDVVIDKRLMEKFQVDLFNVDQFDKKSVISFIQKILEAGDKRNYTIVMLMAYGGLRISEVLSLKLDKIDLVKGIIYIKGKGSKHRTVPMHDLIKEALKDYLATRDGYTYSSGSKYIFVSRKANQLDRSVVNKLFNKYSTDITPHTLGHYFCTTALDSGFSLSEVAGMARHQNLNTTRIYLNPTLSDLQDKMKNMR